MKTSRTAANMSITDKLMYSWEQFCAWVWRSSKGDDSAALRFFRAFLRIIFIVIRESDNDRITLRASALTFTVVLSLVPMLALGTAVLKGLGAGDQMRQAAYSLIEQFDTESTASGETDNGRSASKSVEAGTEAAAEPSPVPSGTTEQAGPVEVKAAGLTSHLKRAVDQIFDYVDRTDFTTLGTFGILGMLMAALGLLGSIERSMNTIWQTTSGRAFGRKIIDYMALMILLPISVNLALATSASLQSSALYSHIQNILPVLWVQKLLLKALPICILVVTFSLLYQFLPNTRVGYIPALGGGLFGGMTWFWIQVIYVKMQIGVAKYNAIYGSFATLPLFFLWIYLAWVIFLLGAEFSFAFQTWRQYQWKSVLITPVARLAIAFDIMEASFADYKNRKITNRKSLAGAVNQTEKTVTAVVNQLIEGGLLRTVGEKIESYVPAAPMDNINPSEVMDIILGRDLPEVKGCELTHKAMQAARSTMDHYTMNCRETLQSEKPKCEDSKDGAS